MKVFKFYATDEILFVAAPSDFKVLRFLIVDLHYDIADIFNKQPEEIPKEDWDKIKITYTDPESNDDFEVPIAEHMQGVKRAELIARIEIQ